MQTFLPYTSFTRTAFCLDSKRLGKQRVECKQILKALRGEYAATGAWVNHPATRMWREHENALCLYATVICAEWRRRGNADSLMEYFQQSINGDIVVPDWFNNDAVFASHRSNLLRKFPQFYQQFNWNEPDNLPYVWPVH